MGAAEDKLELANKHLAKVLLAWDPPDWLELSLFGFYALEAAVEAAAIYHGIAVNKNHPARVSAARDLHESFELSDIADLLRDLNETRKSEAYGDVTAPDLDAEDVASAVESYVSEVSALLRGDL